MLHEQRTAQYAQRVYTPGVATRVSDAWLACIGRLRGTGSFDLEQLPRTPSLHVIQAGAGWLSSAGGQAVPLAPGDVFAVLPGERARYREDPLRPWRYTWLGFDGAQAVELLHGVGIAGSVRVLRQVATPALWRLCDEAEAAYTAERCSPFTPAAFALRLAEALVPMGSPAQLADPAAALRLIIDAGYDGDLTVGGAANRLGVDRSTLFRRFRAAYGCGPRAYLQRVRLERAHALLLRGADTVTAIAAVCGYDDHRAFARAFRARYGVSPSQAGSGPRSAR
jgi:AraC-like DNA-binding protein